MTKRSQEMTLQNNPFYLLKVSCSAGRREIVSAADEMSFMLDSETNSKAQNELINLNKRLSSEINWFIDVDEETVKSIRSYIDNKEPIPIDGLYDLSKLNATLFNFSLSDEEDSYEIGYSILDIDEQYSSLDIEKITNTINQNREEAKLSIVQVQDVQAELGRKREEIRQIITEKLSVLNQDAYIDLVTMLAEKCIADDDYNDGVVLSDVIDQYEIRMQSALEESTNKIKKHIERIKSLANDEAVSTSIDLLIRRIEKWDILAQPLQLKSQASGIPHEISEHLGSELRDLALFLHNEKNLTKEALTLVDAMKNVFAELGVLSDQFESDSETLDTLLEGKKEAEEIVTELNFLQNESEEIKSFPSLTRVNSFVKRIKNLDRRIIAVDLDSETKTKIRESLCYMARSTAIELHNAKHQTLYALTIAAALNEEFGDLPLLRIRLAEDAATLRQQFYYAGNRTPLTHSSDNSDSSSGNTGFLIGFFVIVGIIVLIAIISSLMDSSRKTTGSSNRPSSTYVQNNTSSVQNNNSSSDSGSAVSSVFLVSLDRAGGTGGSTGVMVRNGGSMPAATAPIKSGYTFKGYYSSSNGGGTQYYDANMKSVHNWDKSSNGTLYAYWVKKTEERFTSSTSSGDAVYADIVSIFPEIGIYSQGSSYYSYFVCRCKTTSGSTAWVYMTSNEYKNNFDSSVSTSKFDQYAKEVTFASSKRIHGNAKRAESIMTGLSSDTGTLVIDFSSLN